MYPIRHVGWIGLPGGPYNRKVARCINVAGERGVYLIASDADSLHARSFVFSGAL